MSPFSEADGVLLRLVCGCNEVFSKFCLHCLWQSCGGKQSEESVSAHFKHRSSWQTKGLSISRHSALSFFQSCWRGGEIQVLQEHPREPGNPQYRNSSNYNKEL
eukprot:792216-Pyramimonas_sp.AAC.1